MLPEHSTTILPRLWSAGATLTSCLCALLAAGLALCSLTAGTVFLILALIWWGAALAADRMAQPPHPPVYSVPPLRNYNSPPI